MAANDFLANFNKEFGIDPNKAPKQTNNIFANPYREENPQYQNWNNGFTQNGWNWGTGQYNPKKVFNRNIADRYKKEADRTENAAQIAYARENLNTADLRRAHKTKFDALKQAEKANWQYGAYTPWGPNRGYANPYASNEAVLADKETAAEDAGYFKQFDDLKAKYKAEDAAYAKGLAERTKAAKDEAAKAPYDFVPDPADGERAAAKRAAEAKIKSESTTSFKDRFQSIVGDRHLGVQLAYARQNLNTPELRRDNKAFYENLQEQEAAYDNWGALNQFATNKKDGQGNDWTKNSRLNWYTKQAADDEKYFSKQTADEEKAIREKQPQYDYVGGDYVAKQPKPNTTRSYIRAPGAKNEKPVEPRENSPYFTQKVFTKEEAKERRARFGKASQEYSKGYIDEKKDSWDSRKKSKDGKTVRKYDLSKYSLDLNLGKRGEAKERSNGWLMTPRQDVDNR